MEILEKKYLDSVKSEHGHVGQPEPNMTFDNFGIHKRCSLSTMFMPLPLRLNVI